MEEFKSIEQQKYERAAKRVKAVSGFYKHLLVYLVVNIFLLVLNYFNLDKGEKFWSFGIFSLPLFWGIGLLCQAVGLFATNIFFTKDWEDRKIREIIEKGKSRKWE